MVTFVTIEFQVDSTSGFVFFFFTDDCWYLSPKSDIPYGIYEIPISVTDNGGKIGENIVRVNLCDCLTPTECDGRSRQLTGGNVTLGLWAILAMILGSLLLLRKYFFFFKHKVQFISL